MRSRRQNETVLGHCLTRAYLETGDVAPNVWKLAKVTPKASRVAGFVFLWTVSLEAASDESIGIEEFVARGYASRSTVYRWQREFRSLFPEYETPNELARMLLDAMQRSPDHKLSPQLRIAVEGTP